MRKYYLVVIIVGLLLVSSNAQTAGIHTHALEPKSSPDAAQRMEHLDNVADIERNHSPVRFDSAGLDSFIRVYMDTAHIPGLATWCFKDGQVIWQQCYGYANLEDSIEVADTTLFTLYSISKTVTGTAIMQLWERGEFELDDDINDYLPFDVRCPAYPDSPITFRMLMTHTSSIIDYDPIMNPLRVPWHDSPIPLDTFLHEYLVPGGSYYSTSNFNNSVPGTAYEYSNVGISLLGYLVEMLEDSFPTHCQDSIFNPLSMYETSWFLADLDTNNLARGYHWTGSTYIRRPWWGRPWYPSGQLRSSSIQLGQYLAVVMQYGAVDTVRILDSITVDLILSHQFEVAPDQWIGLVWQHLYFGGRWVWGHNGFGDAGDVVMGFCPDENSAVIALTNCDNYRCSWTILDALFDYAQQYPVEEKGTSIVSNKRITTTIFSGPLRLPEGKNCRVFDITGRIVTPDKLRPGIYFVEVEGKIAQKLVKVR